MKRKRFSEEQIFGILKEHDAGVSVAELSADLVGQIVVAVEDAALANMLCRRLRSSPTESGRRYDLAHATDGSARVAAVLDVLPLLGNALPIAKAS